MRTPTDQSLSVALRARLEARAAQRAQNAAEAASGIVRPMAPALELDLDHILTAARETAYRWSVATDQMVWASNAAAVLSLVSTDALASGSAFGLLIDPEHASQRYDAIMACAAFGPDRETPYRVQYRLLPEGRRGIASIWLEEEGRCRIGIDGRPQSAAGVVRVITDRHEREQRLLFLSGHDALTGQMNRTRLTEEIASVLEALEGSPRSGAFMLAAVSDLTMINETYGFEAGDEVIALVGQRLRQTLRTRDRIGRYSSNKFGILLPDCAPDTLQVIAQRLHASVRDDPLQTRVGAVPVTVALGGVLIPDQAGTVGQTLSHALAALERSRSQRSSGLQLYQSDDQEQSKRRRNVAIADEIVRALNDGRMALALQPIVRSGKREPELHECLLRMRRPDGAIVNAGEFIPVAEQFGLCRLIDRRVLELAVDLLRCRPELRLSMNISGTTTGDAEWLDALELSTGGDRRLTERLIVEITETTAILDLETSAAFVRALQAMGCRVAIDDFGAGYTSFRNLKVLGVDMLKIDGAFVKNLERSAEDQVFVRTLIELARNIGIDTVGEWVGDAATADILERAGIGYMQGFHFGAPELAEPVPVLEPAAVA